MDLKHNRTDLKPTICHLMSPMSTMNREFTLYQISDINILQGHVGFKHSPMDKKSPRSSACRSEEKNFFFFFSISLFKESTKCTWTASVQELQGAPGAKSANRHFHGSESDYLSTQRMRMNQLCNVLNRFNMKSQPAKIQQSINKNVIT